MELLSWHVQVPSACFSIWYRILLSSLIMLNVSKNSVPWSPVVATRNMFWEFTGSSKRKAALNSSVSWGAVRTGSEDMTAVTEPSREVWVQVRTGVGISGGIFWSSLASIFGHFSSSLTEGRFCVKSVGWISTLITAPMRYCSIPPLLISGSVSVMDTTKIIRQQKINSF